MRNSDTFSVELERSNGATHLRLAGRFDIATSMDGAAWLAIMAYEHRVHDWGMKFRLVHVPAAIRRIFELTATEHLLSEAVGA